MAAVITLGVLGGLLGLGLVFAADFLKVEVDERIEKVLSLLPGYNCGACGYPGCSGFAEGIVEGEVDKLSNCKPGKDEHYDPIIAYLGEKPGPDGKTITVTK
ncbi:electron transporter RnfB [Candidatus Izimaplasma bacterium ZiA1]|nr:electron transporter RnfB [Candidatus Izimaplasma bacterium ZiA1]